ncbi:MAG TPA: 4a-hydroxytetrahydrobiopterin dehydratase [Telluria sp.]
MNLNEQQCHEGAPAMTPEQVLATLPQVPGWGVEGHHLASVYTFRDFHETIAFVDALAAMIHEQDHHPVLTVSFNHCKVSYTTHSAGNTISSNDFISAARANAIYAARAGA